MDRKAKIFRAFAALVIMLGLAVLTSCEKYIWSPPEVPADIEISFTDHIYPLCHSCHSSWNTTTAYNKLFAKVDTVNPESSNFLTFHSSIVETHMIQVNDTLTLKASDVIKLWASQGANNN